MKILGKRFTKIEEEILEKVADYGLPMSNDIIFCGGEISHRKDWSFDQSRGDLMIPVKNFGRSGGERTYIVHLAPAKKNPAGRPYSLHKILKRAYELWGKDGELFNEFFLWMD